MRTRTVPQTTSRPAADSEKAPVGKGDCLARQTWPREPLLTFRTVVVATLRGLALDHVHTQDTAAHARAVSLFREMVLAFALADQRRQ